MCAHGKCYGLCEQADAMSRLLWGRNRSLEFNPWGSKLLNYYYDYYYLR